MSQINVVLTLSRMIIYSNYAAENHVVKKKQIIKKNLFDLYTSLPQLWFCI